ncbi:MAG: hypothetical protein K9H49_17780 [Bacteroidales bacterium]|nr:hypothetical protein [Bacteroidales bacterium]MCF8391465.1 hypothetical protein [Bacteroidales bacterium]
MNRTEFHNHLSGNRIIFLLMLSLLTFLKSPAQFYEYGQEPASVKWFKIDSKHFRLIYPEEIQRDAFKVLSLLEKNYLPNSAGLNYQPKKIPVILHTHTVRSNGFVVWAPKRMELFMFPDVQNISQDWYSHLSIHEFRHVIQVEKMKQGFSKIISIFNGEMGIGPAAALTPFWLIEGDAVYAETSLSESGRGRQAEFKMGIKANLLNEEKTYSYSKSYLGSYSDYVPDYYQYGYQLVNYARQNYGEDIWSGAFDYIGRRPFLINPLYFYLKKTASTTKVDLYKNTMDHLEIQWTNEAELIKPVDYEALNLPAKKFTSYKYPHLLDNGSVISVKSGYHIIDRFVEIGSDGKEELLFVPGYLNSGMISVKQNKILWDEYIPGFRWKNQSFSVIQEYDFENKKFRNIAGYTTRYTSPSYSYSGDSIVAVETTLSNDFYLVFISALDGGVFNKVPSPENKQLMEPAWKDGDDKIFLTAVNENGKSIIYYDRSDDKWCDVFGPSHTNISNLKATEDFLYFHADFEGRDNIFAYSYDTKEVFKISNSKYGAFQPDVNDKNGRICFTDFTSKGQSIVRKQLSELNFETFENKNAHGKQSVQIEEKSSDPGTDHEVTISYSPKKYPKLSHLFHLHSWALFYYDFANPDIENPEVSPGFSLLSQNHLSTAVSYLSYERLNGDNFFHTGFTYKGWAPVFDFSYSYGGESHIIKVDGVEAPTGLPPASKYNLRTYLPLSFVSGKWNIGVQPIFSLSYYSDYFFYTGGVGYKRGITYTNPRLYLYTFQKTALQDLIPRWGGILDLANLSSPFEDEQRGSVSSVKSTLYIPGLMRGHGIRLKAEKQSQNYEKYAFSNQLTFPRGYPDVLAEKLTKYTFDYYLTLLYPDWNIEGLFYLKRISAQLFSDYIYGEGLRIPIPEEDRIAVVDGSYQSFGAELRFEYHLFRILFPISSGVRFSYLQNTGEIKTEAIFSIDINRF